MQSRKVLQNTDVHRHPFMMLHPTKQPRETDVYRHLCVLFHPHELTFSGTIFSSYFPSDGNGRNVTKLPDHGMCHSEDGVKSMESIVINTGENNSPSLRWHWKIAVKWVLCKPGHVNGTFVSFFFFFFFFFFLLLFSFLEHKIPLLPVCPIIRDRHARPKQLIKS